MDFDAIATGLYVLTSHESDHEGHDKHDSHGHSANMNDHAALFESETLENGESFSYSIPTEMLDTTIFYHDHMSHDGKGSIKISNDGQSGIIKVILTEGDVSFEPLDVIAVTGANPDIRIFVRGDKTIDYGRVMQVMGTINAAGFKRVALITEMPGRGTLPQKKLNKVAK